MSIDRSVVQDSLPASPAPSPARLKRRVCTALWLACLAIAGWAAFAYLLPQRLGSTRWLYGIAVHLSFVGRVLQFHFALSALAIALFALVLRRRWLAMFNVALATILLLPRFATLLPKQSPAIAGPTIRVMSMNLHGYNAIGLQSAQDLAGCGRSTTWPDVTLLKYLPGFRIGHILISPELTCTSARVGGPTGSDHRPVIADVGFRIQNGLQRS